MGQDTKDKVAHMKMKIMEQKFNFDEYRAVFLKDKDEKIISVSFPIEEFYEFVEDLEDTADLRAYIEVQQAVF